MIQLGVLWYSYFGELWTATVQMTQHPKLQNVDFWCQNGPKRGPETKIWQLIWNQGPDSGSWHSGWVEDIRKLLTHCREIWELIWRCLVFDAESIKGREQSSKELLRNAFDALICTSEKLDFQKKSYELFGFNIAVFHLCTKEPVLSYLWWFYSLWRKASL